jgi:hypothetical protein
MDDIKTKQHIRRMADNRWSKQVLEWMPPGRRKTIGRNSGCNGRNRSGRIVDGYRRIAMGIGRYQRC